MRFLFGFVFLFSFYSIVAFSGLEKIDFIEDESSLFESFSTNIAYNSSVNDDINTHLDPIEIRETKKNEIPSDFNLDAEEELRGLIIPNEVDKPGEFIDIYSKPEEVSSEWKSGASESFYKDIAVIKQVVLDGEKDKESRDNFLKSFRDQQDWFDEALSTTQQIDDSFYKQIKEKKFFIGRIANAQRRSDLLLSKLATVLKLSSFIRKKVRLNVLADINTYVLEEIKRGLQPSKNSYLADSIIERVVNENLKEFRKKTIKKSAVNPELLNSINTDIGKLITKTDYQSFSTELRKNITGELKKVSTTIEQRLSEQAKKNNEDIQKGYERILSSLDTKISSTESRLQLYIDRKMQDFDRKLDVLISSQTRRSGIIDLEVVENKIKDYFDERLKGVENKIEIAKNNNESVPDNQVKSIFNISKKNIDKKIYAEVGRQLSSLKEDRIRKFEKLSRRKKKDERRKLLRELLEKELDKNFS